MPPANPKPLITLTTDFGLSDHYVGTMKGVLLSRCPAAQLVDISHEIPAFSLYAAAYTIDQAAPFYPAGTIHLVIVDPGVGTARRALLLEALGQFFIAPDNGVLSMILARESNYQARAITNEKLWLYQPSSTFHGRDLFAPVAAALASGTAMPSDVGPSTEHIEQLPGLAAQQLTAGTWQGKILTIDHFGNVITNLPSARFSSIASQPFALKLSGREVTQWRETFGSAPPEECFAYFGSSGYVEIGINQANAARLLGAIPGDAITLQAAGS